MRRSQVPLGALDTTSEVQRPAANRDELGKLPDNLKRMS